MTASMKILGTPAPLLAESVFQARSSKDADPDQGENKRHALASLTASLAQRTPPPPGRPSAVRMPADDFFELLALYERDAQ